MPNYQRKFLANGSNIGGPGPIPVNIANLDDASLADLTASLGEPCASELGFSGQGFFPITVRNVSALGFKQRLTAAKRIAIRVAAASDPIIFDFLDLLASADLIDLDHEDTVNGLAYLVSQDLLTADEVAEIRA